MFLTEKEFCEWYNYCIQYEELSSNLFNLAHIDIEDGPIAMMYHLYSGKIWEYVNHNDEAFEIYSTFKKEGKADVKSLDKTLSYTVNNVQDLYKVFFELASEKRVKELIDFFANYPNDFDCIQLWFPGEIFGQDNDFELYGPNEQFTYEILEHNFNRYLKQTYPNWDAKVHWDNEKYLLLNRQGEKYLREQYQQEFLDLQSDTEEVSE